MLKGRAIINANSNFNENTAFGTPDTPAKSPISLRFADRVDVVADYGLTAHKTFNDARVDNTQRAVIQQALDDVSATLGTNSTARKKANVYLREGYYRAAGLKLPYGTKLTGSSNRSTWIMPDDYDFTANPLQGGDITPYIIGPKDGVIDSAGVHHIQLHGSDLSEAEAAASKYADLVLLYLRALWSDVNNAGATGGWHRCDFSHLRFSAGAIPVWSRGGYASQISNLTNQYITFYKCEGTNPANTIDGWRFTGDHAQIDIIAADSSCKAGNYQSLATATSLFIGHDPAPIKCHQVIDESGFSANKGSGEVNLYGGTLQSQKNALKVQSSGPVILHGTHVESIADGFDLEINSDVVFNGVTCSNIARASSGSGIAFKVGANCSLTGTYKPGGTITTSQYMFRTPSAGARIDLVALGTQGPTAEQHYSNSSVNATVKADGRADIAGCQNITLIRGGASAATFTGFNSTLSGERTLLVKAGVDIVFETNASNHLTLPDGNTFTLKAGYYAIFQRNNTGFALISHNQNIGAVKHIAVANAGILSRYDINVIDDAATVSLPSISAGELGRVQIILKSGHSATITDLGDIENTTDGYLDVEFFYNGTEWSAAGKADLYGEGTVLPPVSQHQAGYRFLLYDFSDPDPANHTMVFYTLVNPDNNKQWMQE